MTFADGDAGVLVADGDQGGGYALYVDETGELVFVHNGYGLERELRGPLVAAGDHEPRSADPLSRGEPLGPAPGGRR